MIDIADPNINVEELYSKFKKKLITSYGYTMKNSEGRIFFSTRELYAYFNDKEFNNPNITIEKTSLDQIIPIAWSWWKLGYVKRYGILRPLTLCYFEFIK